MFIYLFQSAGETESASSINSTTAESKASEQSPPDVIVASYAAAARAAALACHQPISKAAEVFLATSSSGRSRHPKRLRNRMGLTEACLSTTSTSVDSSSSPVAVCSNNILNAQAQGWRRILDREANRVIYIS